MVLLVQVTALCMGRCGEEIGDAGRQRLAEYPLVLVDAFVLLMAMKGLDPW